MKRIVCLLIAALSVSLLLGGCGQNSDPLAIREFIIGDSIGTVEQRGSGKDAEYVILGGRMVLDLTLEHRDLIIENGSSSRSYGFEIGLSR